MTDMTDLGPLENKAYSSEDGNISFIFLKGHPFLYIIDED